MILQAALIATQTLLYTLGGSIETTLWIIGFACGVKHDPRIEMHFAISRKTWAGFLYDNLA
ncbi:hypothetical protein D3C87_2119190 [compost metagenome]